MDRDTLEALLTAVSTGGVPVGEAIERLSVSPVGVAPFATLDLHRAVRTGVPEIIFGEGKTADQIAAILDLLRARGQDGLVTRIDADKAGAVLARLSPGLHEYHAVARILESRIRPRPAPIGAITVVCAGTSDLPVAEEAAVTAESLGQHVDRVTDVGVAGLHRVLAHVDGLRSANVIVVVAGMEGALPSVVSGLVAIPVIAVPTSVGYGASFGGLAALLAMLNACAAGVTVVNIDNGFGAGFSAAQVNRLAVEGHPRSRAASRG